jgi:hypothetical protein
MIPKLRQMKRCTPKLSSESSLRPLQMNLLVVIMQLIVMSKNVCSRTTPARSNNPNKLANLNNGVRRQLMQLHLKFAQNNSLIFPRIGSRLYASCSGKTFWKVASGIFGRCDMGLSDF